MIYLQEKGTVEFNYEEVLIHAQSYLWKQKSGSHVVNSIEMKKKDTLPLDFITPQNMQKIEILSINKDISSILSTNIDTIVRCMMSDIQKRIIAVDLSPDTGSNHFFSTIIIIILLFFYFPCFAMIFLFLSFLS
jgi:hypothetical protein